MRFARRYFETLTNAKIEPGTADFQHRLTLKHKKELPRFRMKMPTLAVSWRYALLNYAQFRAVEQVPSLACRTPLIPLAGCDVYDSKHDVLRMCRLTPRIGDALPTYPENHFIHTAFAACAC